MLNLRTDRAPRWPTVGLVTLATIEIVLYASHLQNPSFNGEPPVVYRIGRETLLAAVLCYPLVVWFQRAVGQRRALSLGEWFGIAPATYLTMAWATSWVFPDGGAVPLLLFMAFGWLLAAMVVGSVVLLFAKCFGVRRDVPYQFTDYVGIGIVMAFAIVAFVELRMYPPAW